jgi:hypothetical protein
MKPQPFRHLPDNEHALTITADALQHGFGVAGAVVLLYKSPYKGG